MQVLVVTNLSPDPATPQRGRWVEAQVEALRARGLEVETHFFPTGRRHYLPAIRAIRSLLKRRSYDLVHAHYGLAGWCALLAGARPLVVTFHGTDVRHPLVGPMSRVLVRHIRLAAGVSSRLFEAESGRRGLTYRPRTSAVLPCGPELNRFKPVPQVEARVALGLDPAGRYLFFPADPKRPEKRYDRAQELARACRATLLTGGDIEPTSMPSWISAADAVVVPSDYEGFGMACLEALACARPVLSTPVGIAPFALEGLEECLVEPYRTARWASVASEILERRPAVLAGPSRAAGFGSAAMADRVIHAYEDILGEN